LRICLNVIRKSASYSFGMSMPDQPFALPLEYAAQIIFELNSMRGECSSLAKRLLSERPVNEEHLEECVRLDEALARAHAILQGTVDAIKAQQVKRRRTSR
jgi:hypothetical protein